MQQALALGLVITFLIACFEVWQTWRLRARFEQVLGKTDSPNLEGALATYYNRVNSVSDRLDKLTSEYKKLSVVAGLASQKISVVRFNPFGDTGGDQSFALAVLDSHNSGYVITSIHGREGTRVYIKPIDFGKSKYTLSREEQLALEQATKRVPRKEGSDHAGEKK